MKKYLLLFLLFVLFEGGIGYPSGFSQESSGEGAWTLEECIQIGLKNRPELEISNLDIANAEYQIKEAQSYYYPRLNMATGYTRFSGPLKLDVDIDLTQFRKNLPPEIKTFVPDFLRQEFEVGKQDLFTVTLELTQPIYTFGRIKEGVNQARIGRSFAFNQKEKKRTEIIYEVKKGFYQYLLAKEIHRFLKETEARVNVVVKMVQIAYETDIPEKEGKGTTRLDYLKARNFHSEVRAKLSEMSKNFKLAELALKMAMGLGPNTPLKVAEVPIGDLASRFWSSEELKERTLAKNPDLKSVELGVQFYDSKRKAATKEYFPKIGILGQYVGPEDRLGNSNVWYAGIGLTMPLFDGFQTKARVGQAEVQFQKIRGQKLILEKALSVQVDYLNANLTELKERIQILQAAIKETQERTGLASDGYAAGVTEYDDLLLAQKAELEMKSTYLQTLFAYQMTQAEIEFVSGIQ